MSYVVYDMNMNNVPCDRPGGNACANVNENEDRLGNLAAAVFGNELVSYKRILVMYRIYCELTLLSCSRFIINCNYTN